jgi:hypothetical protein
LVDAGLISSAIQKQNLVFCHEAASGATGGHLFYVFYVFYAWWFHFQQSGALAEGKSQPTSHKHDQA